MFTNYAMDDDDMLISQYACSSIQSPRLPELPYDATQYEISVWAYIKGANVGSLEVFGSQPHTSYSEMRLIYSFDGRCFIIQTY